MQKKVKLRNCKNHIISTCIFKNCPNKQTQNTKTNSLMFWKHECNLLFKNEPCRTNIYWTYNCCNWCSRRVPWRRMRDINTYEQCWSFFISKFFPAEKCLESISKLFIDAKWIKWYVFLPAICQISTTSSSCYRTFPTVTHAKLNITKSALAIEIKHLSQPSQLNFIIIE